MLLRGRLFAGAMFAGALFGASEDAAPSPAIRGGGGHVPFYLQEIEQEQLEKIESRVAQVPAKHTRPEVWASEIVDFEPEHVPQFRAPPRVAKVEPVEPEASKPKRSKARLALIAMTLLED